MSKPVNFFLKVFAMGQLSLGEVGMLLCGGVRVEEILRQQIPLDKTATTAT